MPREFAPSKRTQRPVPDRNGHSDSYSRYPRARHSAHPYPSHPTDRFHSNHRHYHNRHGERRDSYNRGSCYPYRDVSQSHWQVHVSERTFPRANSPRPYKRIEYNQYTPRTTRPAPLLTPSTETVKADLPDRSKDTTVSAERIVVSQRSDHVCLTDGNVQGEALVREHLPGKKQDCGGNLQQSEESVDAVMSTAADNCRGIRTSKKDCQTQTTTPIAEETEVGSAGNGEDGIRSDMEVDHCEVVDSADYQLTSTCDKDAGKTGTVALDVTRRPDPGPHSESQDGPQIPEPAEQAELLARQEVTISGIFSLINDALPSENRESVLRGLIGVFIILKDWVPDNSKDAVLGGLIGRISGAFNPAQEHGAQNSGLASQSEIPIPDNIPQSQLSQHPAESANPVVCDAPIENVEQPMAKPRIRLILCTRNPVDSGNKIQVASPSQTPSIHRKRFQSVGMPPGVAGSAKVSNHDHKNACTRGVSLTTPGIKGILKAKHLGIPSLRKRPSTPFPHPPPDASVSSLSALRSRSVSTKTTATKRGIVMSPVEIQDERNRLTGYQCPSCPQKKPKKNPMAAHMEYHGADGRFSCHKCDFATDSKHVFNGHLKYHPKVLEEEQSARKETGKCDMDESETDDETFRTKNSDQPALPCVDPSCSYRGENCRAIAEHVQREHPICPDEVKETNAPPASKEETQKFQCSDCPVAFNFEGSLIVHRRRVHAKRHHLDAL